MANLKISQLTTFTGTAEDSRWFVMNNIGETETFKFSGYTSPFRYISDSLKNGVYIGTGTNTMTATNSDNLILNGTSNSITQGASRATILGAQNSLILNSSNSVVLGTNTGNNVTSNQSVIAGGTTNQNEGSTNCFIGGGTVNYLLNSGGSGFLGTTNTTFWSSNNSVALGGNSHFVAINSSSHRVAFLVGDNNEVGASTPDVVLIGGLNNTINNTSPYSTIICSTGSTISAKTMASMIGTRARTATQDYALHTENLVLFNYSSLNFADDTAAAAGGVVLGQVYHNAGALRIRIV
jgi:hypothetical protein